MSLLTAEDLAIGYGARVLARDLALALPAGSITCLLGPNGVGKTTLFKTLLGLIPAQAGRILLQGEPLARLGRSQRARRIAYVPQAHAGDAAHAVLDLVVMGRTAHLGTFATPGPADLALAHAALGLLGIAELALQLTSRISGGQLQLALIARALAQQAAVIVMDEPTASLDLGNRIRVLDQIRALAGSGLAILLATHEPEQAFALADRVAVLTPDGQFATGPVRTILTAERLSRLYQASLLVEQAPSGRLVVSPAVPAAPSQR